MLCRKKTPWEKRLKAMTKKGATARVLFEIVKPHGFNFLKLIDRIWCDAVSPDSRPGMKR